MTFLNNTFEGDVLYDDSAIQIIKEAYPDLVVEDARDFIHTNHVAIRVPNVTNEEFYKFAVEEGFAEVLLGFHIQIMRDKNFRSTMLEYLHSLRQP